MDAYKRNWKTDLLGYLPEPVRALLGGVDAHAPLEEIRICANAPVQLRFAGYERMIAGGLGAPLISEGDCRTFLQRLCGQSVYAWEGELAAGFLTLEGGYRVGLCGRMGLTERGIPRLTDVTGFNIRIAREVPGAAGTVLPRLLDASGRLHSTLIVSPPGCGKTTLLRDIARCCSYGLHGARPARVAIVDTRYELSGSVRGVPQLDVGPRTDVLSGVEKARGMSMMVNNMSPELLVTDELGTLADARAVFDAISAGTAVVASAHAGSVESLLNRRALAALLAGRLFCRIVFLCREVGAGTVEAVLDASLHSVGAGGAGPREVPPCCAGLLL